MEAIDVTEPDLGPSMRQLRQVRQRFGPELEQMLALHIALRACARDRSDVLGAMLAGSSRRRAGISAHA